MTARSMMKDYVCRQLRYWVDDFKDGMLPRDFMTKSYTKTQLVLPDIHLKPHRVAAVLHLPSPLLVTTVHCIELTIAVPSWTDADKEAAHKPILIHVNELSVQVHNIWECSSKIRRAAEERVQAALLEPDPLGSTADMFEFARDVNDQTKLVVDKLRIQIFIGYISRVEFVLADLNARATDALWQDVKDPTTCVDYSPDHLVQTRFKAMSFLLSAGINPLGGAAKTSIRLMTKVSVLIRVTRFYHRNDIADSWRRQMQLVDVNFGAVKLELGVAEFMEVYTVVSTLCNWILNGRNCLSAPVDGMSADREPLGSGANGEDQPNIELQITFRGTIEAKLKFSSPTEGPQELFLIADRAAGNVIFHRHGVRELQMSLHELAVRFRGYVVFRLKPDREVFHLEERLHSLSIKWRVQSVLCRIDDDLAAVLTEMYHLVDEKEQAIVIKCGTCHQQISLDMIDAHVCPPRNGSKSLSSTPQAGKSTRLESRRNSFSEASSGENTNFETEEDVGKTIRVRGQPKVHVVLHMNELEVQTGSRTVQILLKLFGVREVEEIAGRDVTTKLSNLRLTTESTEFAGDTIFVPALPLAFQMLECSLQGCGCTLRRKEATNYRSTSYGVFHGYRLPARVFLDIAHCTISAQECCVKVDRIQIRSTFSDGSRVCSSSQPQLSFHVNMDKIRCQLDDVLFKLTRRFVEHIGGSSTSKNNSLTMTLFLGVLQIRAIELTLQNGGVAEARAKSLLKQAIVVFDNQLGFLCTHSSMDFKTIINSQTMKFVHRKTPAIHTSTAPFLPLYDTESFDENQTQNVVLNASANDTEPNSMSEEHDNAPIDALKNDSSAELICLVSCAVISERNENSTTEAALITPPELEREDASRCIQRMVRRKQLVRQQKQRFEADDYEPGVVKDHIQTAERPTTVPESERGSNLVNPASPSPSVNDPNDSNPAMFPLAKVSLGIPSPIMVLGPDSDLVGEIRGGLTKLMSPLSRTRRSSDSIRGGINRLMSPISRTLSPTGSIKQRPSVQSVAPMVEIATYNVTMSETSRLELEISPPKKSQELREVQLNATAEPPSKDKPLADLSSKREQHFDSINRENSEEAKQNELSETKLAALPDVVRVLVQIGECRLCVPINPREKVDYLCREIVRRYNESFAADRGGIAAVSLQDKHGGVFSPSDSVGFTLSVAPIELLFAYPHEHNGQIRSLARLAAGSSRNARSRSLQDVCAFQQSASGQSVRYSKLPLPLAIALLANESERDLIRSGLCERASEATGEAWPDLALNAPSLDAEKNPLIVEIAWHETCIEVTNGDAFALCRQLLGLCTSRVTSKYVGKILRGRLKVDLDNPLVEWACRRKLAMQKEAIEDSSAQLSDQEQVLNASYEQLKKTIQDTYGVYTR